MTTQDAIDVVYKTDCIEKKFIQANYDIFGDDNCPEWSDDLTILSEQMNVLLK
jgi:hypothetical protein